jgi:hypothetical protein
MAEWRRLGVSHLALGGGVSCACGSAFDGIPVADLERDLVEYVYEKHHATPSLGGVFARAGCSADAACDLGTLLRVVAESPADDGQALMLLLDDLQRAVSGLARNRS